MPDASVPSETRAPTTSTRWCGFGNGSRFTAGKLLRCATHTATGESGANEGSSPSCERSVGRRRVSRRRAHSSRVIGCAHLVLVGGASGEELLGEAGMVERVVDRALADLGQLQFECRDDAALRRARSSRARSPKSRPARGGHLSTVALDAGPAVEDHEKNYGAGGALGHHHLARGQCCAVPRAFATICSSFLEQAEKSGTVARVSTNESFRAIQKSNPDGQVPGMRRRNRKLILRRSSF